MNILHAIVLGIVQGLTEFLPVSSSGHLILVPILFGWPEQPLAFDTVIHLGTLCAVLVALREDLPKLFENKMRLGWTIALASIPALAVGYLFKDEIETSLRSPIVVAVSLALWGALLWVADRSAKTNAEGKIENVGRRRAMFIGVMQSLALIPGTSRSGVTITSGLFTGLSREAAARFSFLLSIPATAAAGALGLVEVIQGTESVPLFPLFVGFLTSFLAGLFAIRFLLKILKGQSYVPFAAYRIALAAVVLWLTIGR
ncbi:undecaprenyl-diphosphatase UppP [bacterium]|nr:undecaprenyl-diphosphatase UppP [bacterium]